LCPEPSTNCWKSKQRRKNRASAVTIGYYDLHISSTVSMTDAGWTFGRSIAVQVYVPESDDSAFVIIS